MLGKNIKDKVVELRKEEKSFRDISDRLNISKSTVAAILKNFVWSKDLTKRLTKQAKYNNLKMLLATSKRRQKERRERYRGVRLHAVSEHASLIHDPLYVLGCGLYWGEGDKKLENGIVRLSNSDPKLVHQFVVFLKRICGIKKEKIKMWLLLYPDNNEVLCKKYWSKITGVSISQFVKSQRIQGRHPYKRLPYGVGSVVVSSRDLKERLLTWIECLGKM